MNENVTFLKIADGACVPQVEGKGKRRARMDDKGPLNNFSCPKMLTKFPTFYGQSMLYLDRSIAHYGKFTSSLTVKGNNPLNPSKGHFFFSFFFFLIYSF